MGRIRFTDTNGTFSIENAENYSGLYFPIAGKTGLKSAVTPNLGGDSKIDQETFLLEPVTIESLHNNRSTRNFWCRTADGGCWSVTGTSAEQESQKFTPAQDASTLTAGFMWQTVKRVSEAYHLEAEVTSFVPVDETAEIRYVRIRNLAEAILRSCIQYGPKALGTPDDYEARSNLMWNASWAINGFLAMGTPRLGVTALFNPVFPAIGK